MFLAGHTDLTSNAQVLWKIVVLGLCLGCGVSLRPTTFARPAFAIRPKTCSPSGLHGSSTSSASASQVVEGDAEAFERITLARHSTKNFQARDIPDEVLKKILALVLRSPSGFNLQPYKCIVVSSREAKERLSKAMLGANRQRSFISVLFSAYDRVLDAGASFIFAADLNSMKNIRKLTVLLEKSGWPSEFVRKVPLYASIFSSGHTRLVRSPLVLVKRLAFAVVGRLGKGMPTVSGAEAWAFKNTMLAVQELLLAATAQGLASCPMEGFDMRRLRKAFRLPLRYSVPIVVSIGYASEAERESKTLRFAPEEVFHRDNFGTALEGIPEL